MTSISYNNDNYISISHGINLQVLAYIIALGGYFKYSRKHIIMLIIILFIANSVPDISTFYNDEIIENIKDKEDKIKSAYLVFITEIVVIFILVLPIIVIRDKVISFLISYILSFLLLFVNNKYNLKYSNTKNFEIIFLFIIISYIIFSLTNYTDNYFYK